jgi:hypothetical protein
MGKIKELFKAAGYENYSEMLVNKKYYPKKGIEVNSYNVEQKKYEWKKVTGLYYKGMSDPEDSYEIIIFSKPNNSFICTGKHAIFLPLSNEFKNVEDLTTEEIALSPEGKIKVIINKINYSFPILDMEVDDNHNYISETIVSHNTFGSTASVMAEGLKIINPILSRFHVPTIFINQVRAKIGGMPGYGPQENYKVGGFALPFYSSWSAKVSRVEDIIDKKETIGITIKVKNMKSKIGIPKRSVNLDLYYATGFNPDMEYIDFIINFGYVKKAGAWLSNEEWGMKVQGKNGLLDFLKKDMDKFEELKNEINASFSKTTVLDMQNDEDEKDELGDVDPLFL